MKDPTKAYSFYCSCVSFPGDVNDLCAMNYGNRLTSRQTFLKHVDREELADLERAMGYDQHPSQGLTMAGDFHVSYHRSTLRGQRCYFFRHSAIEYIFTR